MFNYWDKLDKDLQGLYRHYLEIREKGPDFAGVVHPAFKDGYRIEVLIRYSGDPDTLRELGFTPQGSPEGSTEGSPGEQEYPGTLDLANLERIAALEAVRFIRWQQAAEADPARKIDPRLKLLMDRQQRSRAARAPGEPEEEPLPDFIGALIKFRGPVDTLVALGCQVTAIAGDIASVRIPIDRLEAVVAHPNVLRVETNRGYRPDLDDSIKETKTDTLRNSSPPFGGAGKFTGKDVIVGVIDAGFMFTHNVFRDPSDTTKSRILFLWDQSLTPQGGESSPIDVLSNPMYGVEYTKANIETALAAADPSTVVRQEPDGHGTHVAGIAAGNGAQAGNCHGAYHYVGMAPEADFIFVRSTNDSGQLGTSNNLIDAIDYIRRKAISENKPAVINISLGDNLGAHDGTSLVEEMIDVYLMIPGTPYGFSIVKSAGNQGDEERHAMGSVPAGNAASPLELKFRAWAPTESDDPKWIEIDIWYPDTNDLNVQVIPPGNDITGTNTASPGSSTSFTENTKGSTVNINSSNGLTNSKKRIYISVAPPANDHSVTGTWVIKITNTGASPVPFDAWMERDQPAKFTTLVSADRTISLPGTSEQIITVGNYLCKGKNKGKLSSSSSLGPTADNRMKPEIAAPGTDIVSARFATDQGSCCDCCYDFYTAKSGTSMATPHVTGAVALLLEKNPNLTHEEIKTALMSSARKDGFTTGTDNNRFGKGKMDVTAALAAVTAGSRSVAAPPPPPAPAAQPRMSTQPFFAEGSPLARFLATPQGQAFHQLGMQHYGAVRDLVNTNRRMAAIWHRNKGPLLAHHLIRCAMLPDVPLPTDVEGKPVKMYLDNIAAGLRRYGDGDITAALDIALPLAAQLPGMSFREAVILFEEIPLALETH